MRRSYALTGIAFLLAMTACSKPGEEASRTAPATSPEPTTASIPGQTGEPTRDQGEIAGVVNVISETEVAISQVLIDRGVKGPLVDFAKQLQDTHRKIGEKATSLGATKAGVKVEIQQSKQKAGTEYLSKEKDEQALMNAYIAEVVRDHSDALKQLDAELIPAAQGDLKAFLQEVRKEIAEQLEEAQALASARY